MKRYYLSRIYQDVNGEHGIAGAWRHRLQDYENLVDYLGQETAYDQQTGEPTQRAVLVLVGGIDHRQLRDDPLLVPMPDVRPDTKVSAIHTPTKLACKQAIRGFGFGDADVSAVWDNADGLRDVLNAYGRLNNPAFDVDNFDLDES